MAACSAGTTTRTVDGNAASARDAGSGAADADLDGDIASRPDVVAPSATTDDAGLCTNVVDVVFALDVSSSMGFVLEDLQKNIAGVVNAANKLAPDAHFGLIPFVDNYAIDSSGPLEKGLVHTQAPTLEAAFKKARDTYTTPNRNPGDGPSGPETQNPICEENTLDALYAAAREFPWRENSSRVIILATDDTFLEAPDNYGDRDGDGKTDKTNFPREGNYPAKHTLKDTVAALRDAQVRVFSFTRAGFMQDPISAAIQPCGCGTGCRFQDSTHLGDGFWVPYKGEPPIPEATKGKNFDLKQVENGKLSLSETINNVVVQSYCDPPLF